MAMDPVTGAALIGVGSAVVGGAIGSKSAARANAANLYQQERFAKEGIQWKVADAKAAGISPEYALGASTHSFQPTFTGSRGGDMIAEAGQNVARSVLAAGTKADRELDAAIKAETLRGMRIDNDTRATQLSTVNVPGNPPFPHPRGNVIEGQGNSPVKDIPLERTGQDRRDRYSEGGSIPSVGWAENGDGGLVPVPSQDIKNRIEDQIVPEAVWAVNHQLKPNFNVGPQPPRSALPKGYSGWKWSHTDQAFYPVKRTGQWLKMPRDLQHIPNLIIKERR